MSPDPWGIDRCNCDGCTALLTAWSEATWICNHGGEPALVRGAAMATVAAMHTLISLLHKEHMPQCYESESGVGLDLDLAENHHFESGWDSAESPVAGVDNAAWGGEDETIALPPGPEQRYKGKFMVCDHCHGHALNCSESPVCDQCQMSETPCIHRLCRLSPGSKENCSNPDCMDYLPVPDFCTVEDYIILPGHLRTYMLDGAVRRHRWADFGMDALDWMALEARVKHRQERTRDDAERFVEDARGTLKSFSGDCGYMCGISPAMEAERVAKMYRREDLKESRAYLRMIVREETDAAVERAHTKLGFSVHGCDCGFCWLEWDSE
ncbi:hypothetical protein LTR15_006955 [Elasticomyces elasticus]|nr:hypothetical protein LTR15_006955 [Elasticomyces elasticus]